MDTILTIREETRIYKADIERGNSDAAADAFETLAQVIRNSGFTPRNLSINKHNGRSVLNAALVKEYGDLDKL